MFSCTYSLTSHSLSHSLSHTHFLTHFLIHIFIHFITLLLIPSSLFTPFFVFFITIFPTSRGSHTILLNSSSWCGFTATLGLNSINRLCNANV